MGKILSIFLICLFIMPIFFGCEKENGKGNGGVATPVLTPQWAKDFSALDKLCWKMDVKKNNGWRIYCTFDIGIPSVSPNKTIVVEDNDLSKALSRALSQVRSQLGIDSVVIDND